MDSINPQVTNLHNNYNLAMNLLLPMRPTFERWYYEALKAGITPEMLYEVIKHRQRRIQAGVRREESVCIRNLVGSDEAIDNLIEEWAMLASKKRIIVVEPSRASVLSATGRSTEPESAPARSARDVLEAGWEQVKQVIKAV